jgi:SAM-dependent methyltransferase
VIHEIADWFPLNVDVTLDPFARPSARSLPWQYRSVTEWWPEFDSDDAEGAALVDFVRANGQPGLEVGCGSGRRLLACWNAGLDVNGSESPGPLLSLCRERTSHAGVGLFAQRFHELDLPRRYRSIYVGRAFCANEFPRSDEFALTRLYRLLEPGGVLVLNQPAPGHETRGASLWRRIQGRSFEVPELPAIELRSGQSGDVLQLTSQPLTACRQRRLLRYTVRAEHFAHGERKASRGLSLCQRFPTTDETLQMLCDAGFERRRIHHGVSEHGSLRCWIAEKTSSPTQRGQSPLGPIGLAGALRIRN